MLVGRDSERQAIRSLVAGARVGVSAALVMTGEAGIGKSTLLAEAEHAATGMRVLRATGNEAEAGVPFGALLQLLRPALVHLEHIPPPQAAALEAALALRPGTAGDRFAVGAATLSVLSRFAQDQPVAVLVDDAHLLDPPSAQALTFAARRLTADPVVLLAAVRSGHPCVVADAGLPTLEVAGLSPDAAGELVRAAGHRLSTGSVQRLYAATGGNPLALLELAVDGSDLEGRPVGAPLEVPASLARSFARRADRLSPVARSAVLVAAAGGPELVLVADACALLGVPVAALAAAEEAGLLRAGEGVVVFRHDLVRSALWSEATPAQRRAVHAAIAAALPATDPDRRAWHLGQAALGPDETTAAALSAAGDRARDRSAHAVAAGAYEQAARLSPDPGDRATRLVCGAESAWDAGMPALARALLSRAKELPRSAALRARAAGLRGTVASRTGSVHEARDVLTDAARQIADADPDTAILLLGDAILACFFLLDTGTVAQIGSDLDRLAVRATTDRSRSVAAVGAGMARMLTGRAGADRIRQALDRVAADAALMHDPRMAPWLVSGHLFLRESGTGRALVEAVVADLRERSAVGWLPFLLFEVGRDQATTDRWAAAESTYTEGVHLARETGHTSDLTACLAGLAWLEARQGREADCRAHAAEALLASAGGSLPIFEVWSYLALGELELGLGRADAAIEHLEHVDALLGGFGLGDVDLSPAPELVDALLRVGRTDEARTHALRHERRAAEKGQPWSCARAARACAMTSRDAEAEGRFAQALEHHALTPDSYELARTRLAYGSWLRRRRRRVEARRELRPALALFDELGAAPWAEQSAAELRATGETAQRRTLAVQGLTPQELQVARMLAGGRTTKEAAAALFLSPKTIEYHLRHVYVKLGVRNRSELAAQVDQR